MSRLGKSDFMTPPFFFISFPSSHSSKLAPVASAALALAAMEGTEDEAGRTAVALANLPSQRRLLHPPSQLTIYPDEMTIWHHGKAENPGR
jgi:hypothetical protein